MRVGINGMGRIGRLALRAAICFQPLEDFLGVVQDGGGRIEGEGRSRRDFRCVPALFLIPADDGHVVGKQRAESKVLKGLEAIRFGHGVGIRLDVEGKRRSHV